MSGACVGLYDIQATTPAMLDASAIQLHEKWFFDRFVTLIALVLQSEVSYGAWPLHYPPE